MHGHMYKMKRCVTAFVMPHRMHRVQMRPIVANVRWSVCVCLFVITMSCAKMAEPVEMLFECGLRWVLGTIC